MATISINSTLRTWKLDRHTPCLDYKTCPTQNKICKNKGRLATLPILGEGKTPPPPPPPSPPLTHRSKILWKTDVHKSEMLTVRDDRLQTQVQRNAERNMNLSFRELNDQVLYFLTSKHQAISRVPLFTQHTSHFSGQAICCIQTKLLISIWLMSGKQKLQAGVLLMPKAISRFVQTFIHKIFGLFKNQGLPLNDQIFISDLSTGLVLMHYKVIDHSEMDFLWNEPSISFILPKSRVL